LVSTAWLASHLDAAHIKILDASWYLPGMGRDAKAEYALRHIPGARFFDLDAVCDANSALPHMLPQPVAFAAAMSRLGLSNSDRVVIYDASNCNFTAPRAWWMLRVFGHDDAAVLDGGLGKWRREGRPLAAGAEPLLPGRFTARMRPELVREFAAMLANLKSRREQVIDARSPARFEGREPEPRPGLRAGHIPGSLNLHYTRLVAKDGTLLPAEALRELLQDAGVREDRPVVATCGSGVSACALLFALHLLGRDDIALYDGSWVEWGGRAEAPVASA
jgi:thiosulfate/3-mercaptopyruvate sulfurtransferase